jgi:transposase
MVRPDFKKWGQSLQDIQQLSIHADHARTRERFQALYLIGIRQTNATAWAKESGRKPQTIMNWVHQYNEKGPEAMVYQQTGGRPLFLEKQSVRK